ncbi:MAG: response regulator [Treponema sp.]|jgi:signal transduction histidine kinase/HPt (histidine-containing phosphotransfer) domain-containing protein/ActR/RegA family two-component response regulator|nr:response regulator [Treponema sp.]
MSQLLIQIITGVNAIVSIGVLFMILANWGQPRMKYLASLAIVFAINAIGYYLEVNAGTLEAAMVAYKIQYCAGNYIGPFASLFVFEYSDRPVRKWPVRLAIFVIPVFITLLVFINPALYISDITFSPLGPASREEILRLDFKSGGFYIVNFIYGFTTALFSSIFIVVWFLRTNRRGIFHGIIFLGMVILPFVCKLLWWLGFFPEIDFFYICSTFMILVLYFYIMRYRQIEWFSLGRDAIMERLGDAVMVVNSERVIINVNSIFFHFFPGFPYVENRTTLADFLNYLKGHTLTPPPQSLFDDIDPALQDFYEFTVIPDPGQAGEQRTYTLTWQTIRTKKRFLGQVIILSDVSAFRTMIKEVIKLKQRAEEASRSKSEFLATVSHEIRTPLNAIIGLSEIQLQNDLSPEARETMEKIYASGSGLLSIINDILDISKIETGNLELIPVYYSVPSLVNDTVQLNIIRIGSKPITFELDIDESVPMKLWGDEKRVRQILNNLLSNAFKYTREGTVSLQIEWTAGYNSGKMTFKVKDTGQGIKREDMGKLFSQYGQLNARANRNIEGTGLGLSITKNLVELMNGAIEVESEFGKGSTFTVTIYQEVKDPVPIGSKIAESLKQFRYTERRAEREKSRPKRQYPGGRVLVVDDVETNLYVARGLLQPYGLTVDCVKSGQEAIANIFSNASFYNIVFMDHMMPGMDGIETTRIIRDRRSEYTESLPVIALTANAIVGMREMFLENGFNDYLSKPIERSNLDEILFKWMPDSAVFQDGPFTGASAEASGEFKAYDAAAPQPPADKPHIHEIPPIEGVDMEQGIVMTGGSPELYRDILALYCKDVAGRLALLSEIPRPEKLLDFATHVHAIKSASANIGAEEMRNRAAGLEMAAKSGDLLFIELRLGAFASELGALLTRIQNALYPSGLPDCGSLSFLTDPEREALGRLRKALETQEIRLIENAIREIKAGNPSPALQRILDDITGNILVSEFAEAAAIIGNL